MDEQERPLLERLRAAAEESLRASTLVASHREAEVMEDLHTIFTECADTIDALKAGLTAAREYEETLRSAIGELSGEQEALQYQVAQLSETFVDERQVVWRPPTAWAYAQTCRVNDRLRGEVELLIETSVGEAADRLEEKRALTVYVDELHSILSSVHPHLEYEDDNDRKYVDSILKLRDQL